MQVHTRTHINALETSEKVLRPAVRDSPGNGWVAVPLNDCWVGRAVLRNVVEAVAASGSVVL